MNRGVAVFSNHTLRDEDGVFEVVAIPGHECHQHVLAQSQFAQVRGCAISDNVTLGEFVTAFDDGALVDVGVLVGALVFDQVVNINADFTCLGFRVIDTHHNARGIDVVDHATAKRCNHRTRVDRSHPFDASADKGLSGRNTGTA